MLLLVFFALCVVAHAHVVSRWENCIKSVALSKSEAKQKACGIATASFFMST